MNTFISMLRGINVSGQKQIRMAELRSLYESLGLANVRSYVQSGNVVFESTELEAAQLARLIEAQIEQTFGYSIAVFIRDRHDFERIIAGNPFTHQRNEDPAKLHVTFLSNSPDETKLSGLVSPNEAADEFFSGAKEIFLFCPNGYGLTKWSNNFFEKKLKMPATTRNWKTVKALYQMAHEP